MTGSTHGLLAPAGSECIPDFDRGWVKPAGERDAFLPYVEVSTSVNWSEELEQLHVESSRDHFIDVYTRSSVLSSLGGLPQRSTIADIGCSTGYLLDDLDALFPHATLIGVDMIASGLCKAHALVARARLLQADACDLPIEEASVDAVLSVNLLEHIQDDLRALDEIRRVLRPGGAAVVVVPTGPSVYDYYDRFLGHVRRYGRGEMAEKARTVGLEVDADFHLGSLLYPPFWLVKQRNRRRFASISDEMLERRVAQDISGTKNSLLGGWTCTAERGMRRLGIRLPFGVRGLTVMRRPQGDT
ncbi:MAG TPA: class I SAM-dependent methyltransferase [Solirubrobacteraceae bacterium]|jgi:SAM-dependent methyltransferase|nr:class I SAM-dependent methyltransferase [Solirubrobacteraceae bacterium]